MKIFYLTLISILLFSCTEEDKYPEIPYISDSDNFSKMNVTDKKYSYPYYNNIHSLFFIDSSKDIKVYDSLFNKKQVIKKKIKNSSISIDKEGNIYEYEYSQGIGQCYKYISGDYSNPLKIHFRKSEYEKISNYVLEMCNKEFFLTKDSALLSYHYQDSLILHSMRKKIFKDLICYKFLDNDMILLKYKNQEVVSNVKPTQFGDKSYTSDMYCPSGSYTDQFTLKPFDNITSKISSGGGNHFIPGINISKIYYFKTTYKGKEIKFKTNTNNVEKLAPNIIYTNDEIYKIEG